jgi:hypothetical protein
MRSSAPRILGPGARLAAAVWNREQRRQFLASPFYSQLFALAGAPPGWIAPTPFCGAGQQGKPYAVVEGYCVYSGSVTYSSGIEQVVIIPRPWDLDNPLGLHGTAAGGTAQAWHWTSSYLATDNEATNVAALKDSYTYVGSWGQTRSPARFHSYVSLPNDFDATANAGLIAARPAVQILGGSMTVKHAALYNAGGRINAFSTFHDQRTHGYAITNSHEQVVAGVGGHQVNLPMPGTNRTASETATIEAFIDSYHVPQMYAGSSDTASGNTTIHFPPIPQWMLVGKNASATDNTTDSSDYGQLPFKQPAYDILQCGGISIEPTAGVTNYTVIMRVVMAVLVQQQSGTNDMSYLQLEQRSRLPTTQMKVQDESRFLSHPVRTMGANHSQLLNSHPETAKLSGATKQLVAAHGGAAAETTQISAMRHDEDKPSFWSEIGDKLLDGAKTIALKGVEKAGQWAAEALFA